MQTKNLSIAPNVKFNDDETPDDTLKAEYFNKYFILIFRESEDNIQSITQKQIK